MLFIIGFVVASGLVVVVDVDLPALADVNGVVTLIICEVVGAFLVISKVSVAAKALVAVVTVVAVCCDVVIWTPAVKLSIVVATVFVGETKSLGDVTTVVLG